MEAPTSSEPPQVATSPSTVAPPLPPPSPTPPTVPRRKQVQIELLPTCVGEASRSDRTSQPCQLSQRLPKPPQRRTCIPD
ncbi:hypothetical protein QUB07_32790 [Microcoleus sp. F8-C5]